MTQYTFNKKERLKSKKQIDALFSHGNSLTVFPIKVFYVETRFKDSSNIKAAVSVGKKKFKKAIDRNRIKRLLREAYRLNKPTKFNNSETAYALLFLYIGKEMPSFENINNKMEQLLNKLSEKIFVN